MITWNGSTIDGRDISVISNSKNKQKMKPINVGAFGFGVFVLGANESPFSTSFFVFLELNMFMGAK